MGVGLDIGSKSIKVVETAPDGQAWKLKAAGIIGYVGNPPEKINTQKEIDDLAALIKKLFKDSGIGEKKISVALPEGSAFTRLVNFPLLNDQEIASAIKWEAEQYIPIPIEEAVVQHTIIERNETTTPPTVSVLLVAAPRTVAEKYVQVVTSAGLEAEVVETELLALTRSLAPIDKTVLLVDFGAKSTDIAVSKNGNLMFTRSIPTAGEAFTRAVAQMFGVEHTQAEEYKRTYGLSKAQLEGKVAAAIAPIFDVVTDEIKKAIHFYESETRGGSPTQIILSGGSSGMGEGVSIITKATGIEVIVGNPFVKLSLNADLSQKLTPYAPLYAIAVGLSLRK